MGSLSDRQTGRQIEWVKFEYKGEKIYPLGVKVVYGGGGEGNAGRQKVHRHMNCSNLPYPTRMEVSSGVMGNSLFRVGLLPRCSFGGVGGPEWRCGNVKVSSFGGVGGRLSLLAVYESLGGVGGGRPWEFSRSCSCERDRGCVWSSGRPRCASLRDGGGGKSVAISPCVSEALRLLRPPTLEDSAASSTTGSVVPISPRSADGLRTTRSSREGTCSSVRPRCRERSA